MNRAPTKSWARVAKNTAIMIALKFLMPMLSLVLISAVSRFLGTEGLGRYTLVFAFFNFSIMLTPLGLDTYMTREGVRDADGLPVLLGNVVVLGTASSVLATGLMAVLGTWLGYDAVTRAAMTLLGLAILPSTLIAFLESIFVARERFEFIAASSFVEFVIKVGGGVAALLLGYGVPAVVIAFMVSRCIACLLAGSFLYRLQIPLQWRIDRSVLQRLLRAAPTFLCMSAFGTLYWRIDTLMLSVFRDLTDVAYYGAAYRLMVLIKILPQSLSRALYPQITEAAKHQPERLRQLGGVALRYFWVSLLPIATATTLLGGSVLSLLFGETLRAAATPLTLMIWTVLPYACVRYYAYILIAADHQRIDLLLNVVMSGVNILLNLILIPRYGPLGAALTTLVSICLYAIAQSAYIYRFLPWHVAKFPSLFKPMIAACAMGFCIWLGRDMHVLGVSLMAIAVYAVVLLLSRFFTADELRLLHLHGVWAKMRLKI